MSISKEQAFLAARGHNGMKLISKLNHSFIVQTARDYDMECEDVAYIYKHYHDNLYEKLEEFIKERANNND